MKQRIPLKCNKCSKRIVFRAYGVDHARKMAKVIGWLATKRVNELIYLCPDCQRQEKPANLRQGYKLDRTDPGLVSDMRNIWGLVTEEPGISIRKLSLITQMTYYRTRKLVRLLLESGTLVGDRNGGKGSLRATVPLVSMRRKECT